MAALLVLGLLGLSAAGAGVVSPWDPAVQDRERPQAPPGREHLLGTDELGRDLLSRLLHAGRWSLVAASGAVALSMGAGAAAGLLAATAGGRADQLILWCCDLTMSLPWLYVLFAIRGLLPLSLRGEIAFAGVILLLGVIGWPGPARVVRASAQVALQSDYVRAARGFGATRWHLMKRHLLPAAGWALLPQFFVLLPRYVMAEASLSFFGLGLGEPVPSWGTMLAAVRHGLAGEAGWWMFAPVVPMVLLLISSSVLAASAHRKT
ncbi:MAG: ABC transporter permease [Bryobacterales bacterium]|nr:ABC transporter permease [Bryobacterales bacterium]